MAVGLGSAALVAGCCCCSMCGASEGSGGRGGFLRHLWSRFAGTACSYIYMQVYSANDQIEKYVDETHNEI